MIIKLRPTSTDLVKNKGSMKLAFKFDDGRIISHEVFERTFTVGRSEKCRICIPSEHFSREHGLIELLDGKVFITDLESKNGIFINHVRIPKKMKVNLDLSHSLYLGECFLSIDISNDLRDPDNLSLETLSHVTPNEIYHASQISQKILTPKAKIPPVPIQKKIYDGKGILMVIMIITAILGIHRYRQDKIIKARTEFKGK
jgi:predicted component of type VI protein secretion system